MSIVADLIEKCLVSIVERDLRNSRLCYHHFLNRQQKKMNFAGRNTCMVMWFFWTCGETEGVANSFLGKMYPEALLDKALITHQVCL
jgi:hypothetical protein